MIVVKGEIASLFHDTNAILALCLTKDETAGITVDMNDDI